MNGKLDLTRAESVMELVSARSDRGRAGAVDRLAGALEEEIRGLADRLKVCLAGMELYLDYSEDDGIAPEEEEGGFPGRKAVETIRARVRHLADSYRLERIYRDGALGVIAGRPNAGKSSLFNLLLKEDRSLVSEIPGTTRDWIESGLSLEGIPLRLADTAGLRGSAGPEDPAGLLDPVEELGIRRSRELLAAADLVIYLIDGTRGLEPEDREFFNGFPQVGEAEAPAGWNPRKPERGGAAEGSVPAGGDLAAPGGGRAPPLIVLWNKGDLCPLPPELPGGVIEVSAKTGAGTEALIEAIRGALEGLSGGGQGGASSAGAGTARQKELLDRAAASLGEALSLGDRGGALDLIAPALREALNALGEITGEVSTADILETMFSRFCVGK
jgi:tRNA modification GTPase